MTEEQQAEQPVDLTNCDREPIHTLGRVQSFGVLLSVSSDWIINHASENAVDFLGRAADELIGTPLSDVFSDQAIHKIRNRLQYLGHPDAIERLFDFPLQDDGEAFDVALHMSGRSIIIELERRQLHEGVPPITSARSMIDRLTQTDTVDALCDGAVRYLKALTDFDRVMLYRFEDDDTGTVIAEALNPDMEAFKGLRYPASDIPKQARALYKRNLIRIISDVHDPGSPIAPQQSADGEPVDLSLSTTRAVSPIHLEYLRNMGVGASMSISILKRGELWGLFACHHNAPRTLSYEMRSAAEFFGQMFGFLLEQRLSDIESEQRDIAQRLHDRLMAQLAGGRSVRDNVDSILDNVAEAIPFDGAAAWIDGQFVNRGNAPTEEEFLGLVKFLNTTGASRVYHTESLISAYPRAESFVDRAAGALALPVSRSPRDYIVLFRQEILKSVTWAGNPEKPVSLGPNGARLTPRKSFEAWQEIVRHHCTPWTPGEVRTAEALRVTLLEVVLRLTDEAVKDRSRAQERQEILIAELNHRVRNILNLIKSLVAQSAEKGQSVDDFTGVIGGRIHALARAHDQITTKNWSPASLQSLIETEVKAYLAEKSHRVKLTGPDAFLHPAAFTTVSLVIHELVTNSAKYGALCDQAGHIEIKLEKSRDDALKIAWSEHGGPPIKSAPVRRGFGTTIIERSIPFELKGKADVSYETTGLRADFMIPSPHIDHFAARGEIDDAAQEKTPSVQAALNGDALIVEDNMIIALDAEDHLKNCGARKVFVASSVDISLELIEKNKFVFALLDLNLGSETSEPVAKALNEKGVPFAFATGYGDQHSLSERYPGAPVVQKPYDVAQVALAISQAGA